MIDKKNYRRLILFIAILFLLILSIDLAHEKFIIGIPEIVPALLDPIY